MSRKLFSRIRTIGTNGHTIAVLGLIVSFIIIFRTILFLPKLILVVDFGIPSTSPYYHVLYFITSWAPHNLGFSALPGWGGLLMGFLVFLSGGNQIMAQKFMLLDVPLACIFMYFFIIRHITKSKFFAFSGAIIYGCGPVVLDNFAQQFLWGYAFLPLIFHYGLDILEDKPRAKDAIAFGLVTAFATSVDPHLLGIVPPALVLFFFVHLLRNRSLSYIARVLKYSFLAISLYGVLSIQTYAFFILSGGGNILSFVAPTPEQFYANYQGLSPANLLRLTGIGNPILHPVHFLYLQGNSIGFVLPILAFSALLVAIRLHHKSGRIAFVISTTKKQQVYALTFSLVVVLVILFVESIRNRTFLFGWLYNHYPPLVTLRDPLAVMMLLSFAYSVLISITGTFIQRQLNSSRKLDFLPKKHILISVLICSLILGSYFLYAPAYDATLQKSTPYMDFPQVYGEAISWMRTQGEDGSFRYLLVPQTHSSQLILPNNYPFQFLAIAGGSYQYTHDYVTLAYNALVQNETRDFGSLIAPANVKYVIVAQNTTEPKSLAWMAQGSPRISGDYLVGNATEFNKIMESQNDLELVEQNNDFSVYQVKDFIPQVAAFQNAIYVVGANSSEALMPIIDLPGYSSQNNLLIFEDQSSTDNTTINYAPTILLYNLGNAQIQELTPYISSPDKSVILLYNGTDFFTEKTNVHSLEIAPLDSINGTSILHGTGTVTRDTINKPEGAQASVTYNGTSESDNLFSLIYSSPNSLDLKDVDEITYYFRLSGARASQNVEFGLIDDSGAARRWYANILPTIPLDTWQKVKINLTSYSQQDAGFDIDHVKQLQFTTYTSQPQTQVAMAVGNVVGTKVDSQEFDLSTLVPQLGNYSLCFKSSTPSTSVILGNVSTSATDKGSGWYETGPICLSNETVNASIILPINGKVEAMVLVNKESLENAFFENSPSISCSFKKVSETQYTAELETKAPVFLALAESYHPDWHAQIDGKELLHFIASSWSNGYYMDRAGNFTVDIEFEQQTPHIVLSAFVLSVFSLSLVFVLYDSFRRIKKTKKGKNIEPSNSTLKAAD
jgi:hypothetical protein